MDAKLQELLQQVTDGSEDAARKLFDKYRKYLLYLIRQRMHKKLRVQFDSIDIAQDVWASFFSEPLEKRAFRTPDQLIAFLTSLAQNKVRDAMKLGIQGKKRNAHCEESMDDSRLFDKELLVGPDATPSHIAMSRDEWTDFLRKQPPVYRKIFLLMRDGKTNIEIAAELGINARLIRRVMNRLTPETVTS